MAGADLSSAMTNGMGQWIMASNGPRAEKRARYTCDRAGAVHKRRRRRSSSVFWQHRRIHQSIAVSSVRSGVVSVSVSVRALRRRCSLSSVLLSHRECSILSRIVEDTRDPVRARGTQEA